jgi:uncharacterized protein (UPF0248 family)
MMVLGFAANLLNRLKWTKRLPESEVVILHRGAPKDQKRIKGDHITEIQKGSFSYVDFETKKETRIPMHRVLEIWMDEKVVWKKHGNGKAKNAKKGKKVPAAKKVKKPAKRAKVSRKKPATRKRKKSKSSR